MPENSPVPPKLDRAVAENIRTLYEQSLLHLGLFGLLKLQQEIEGHMDEHVTDLLLEGLHLSEQQLSNLVQVAAFEDIPF